MSTVYAKEKDGMIGKDKEIVGLKMISKLYFRLLAQQLAGFLQMELQSRRGTVGVTAMILCNVLLDILLVPALGMGVFGLALATSISNWAYFLILVSYYFSGKAQLTFRVKSIFWRGLAELIKIGSPGALLVVAIAAKNLVLNRMLLRYAGTDGLAAISSFYMVCGLILAAPLGAGSVVRMLTSVYIGEENRNSIKGVIRIAFTKVMLLIVVLTVAVVALAPVLAGMFFPDNHSEVNWDLGGSCHRAGYDRTNEPSLCTDSPRSPATQPG